MDDRSRVLDQGERLRDLVGVDGAAQMHEAAGARRIFTSHGRWVGYEPDGTTGKTDAIVQELDAAGNLTFEWNSGDHIDIATEGLAVALIDAAIIFILLIFFLLTTKSAVHCSTSPTPCASATTSPG